jgi:hypothetical protein
MPYLLFTGSAAAARTRRRRPAGDTEDALAVEIERLPAENGALMELPSKPCFANRSRPPDVRPWRERATSRRPCCGPIMAALPREV